MSDYREVHEQADLKTPDEWCKIEGVEILDPDGWRGRNGRPWTDPITLAEFRDRLVTCTQRSVAKPDDRAEMAANRAAGVARRNETRHERAIRRQVAEEIAQALLECRELHFQDRERAAQVARGIGAKELS